jgi:two-component system phosphate regulon response regulator PhoB
MNSHTADVPVAPPLILVVDDDQDTREMYSMFLELSGYRVLSAHDARTALALALAEGPHMVVTDFLLPGNMSGADLCRSLKEHERTAHVPALLVTGSTRRTDAEEAMGAGCADIRLKPYLPDALLRDVRIFTGPPADGLPGARIS